MTAVPLPAFDLPPYRLSGVVVGALLNHAPELAALGDAVNRPPYKAAPVAPVLAVKPRNTWAADGAAVVVPAGVDALAVGATLAIVIGRSACRVAAAGALGCVAGYTVAADIALPQASSHSNLHSSHYRPATALHARDGFCPIGSQVVPASEVPTPDALRVRVFVDGDPVRQGSTDERIRGVADLVAAVSEFMTLQPGDLLLLGAEADPPLVRAGQAVVIEIEGVGRLAFRLVAEGKGG